jgi:hypothetical protein
MDLFVCTNEVNQTIALAGELAQRPRRALVLFDPVRCNRQTLPKVWQLPFSPWADRLVRLMGRLRLIDTAYIPHHRLHGRLKRELRRARTLAYLDDGLDTLRHKPQNFDLDGLAARSIYLTFNEYRRLPDWLSTLDVRRVCSLRELTSAGRKPTLGLDGMDHLFVESPGLDAGAVIAALGLNAARVVCVRHPVPHKRGSLPPLCRSVEGRDHDLEATLMHCSGISMYFGSTMALVVALLTGAAVRNRVYVQLDDVQRDNLLVPARLVDVPAPALRNPLSQAFAHGEPLAAVSAASAA